MVESPRAQGETILLVEDEASILRLVTAMLRDLGYEVLAAGTVNDAIELCAGPRRRIHPEAVLDGGPGEQGPSHAPEGGGQGRRAAAVLTIRPRLALWQA